MELRVHLGVTRPLTKVIADMVRQGRLRRAG